MFGKQSIVGLLIVYDYLTSSIICTDLVFKEEAQGLVISMPIFGEIQVSTNTDHKYCLNTCPLN